MKYIRHAALLLIALSVVCSAGQENPGPKREPDWVRSDHENFIRVGFVTREQILSLKVFNYNYVEYIPQSDPVQEIHNYPLPLEIKVFLGDWCSDSKKHVPAFVKTMEFADNTNIRITYMNMTPDKKEPAGLLAGWNILNVPTFVVLSNGREAGRIVETPKVSIEQDLADILATISSP